MNEKQKEEMNRRILNEANKILINEFVGIANRNPRFHGKIGVEITVVDGVAKVVRATSDQTYLGGNVGK